MVLCSRSCCKSARWIISLVFFRLLLMAGPSAISICPCSSLVGCSIKSVRTRAFLASSCEMLRQRVGFLEFAVSQSCDQLLRRLHRTAKKAHFHRCGGIGRPYLLFLPARDFQLGQRALFYLEHNRKQTASFLVWSTETNFSFFWKGKVERIQGPQR